MLVLLPLYNIIRKDSGILFRLRYNALGSDMVSSGCSHLQSGTQACDIPGPLGFVVLQHSKLPRRCLTYPPPNALELGQKAC